MKHPLAMVPFSFLGLVPSAAAQTTWVVDDNGTGDFVHVQDAVDAAQDGDVIFVLDGAYAGFAIDGRALVVAGEPGGTVDVAAQVVVRNLASGQKVELEGLTIGETFAPLGLPALLVEDNMGSVRIVDCEVSHLGHTYDSYYYDVPMSAMRCDDSEDVGILRTTILGSEDFGYNASAALRASTSNLVITDSTLVGRDGENTGAPSRCAGVPGIGALLLDSSTVMTFGSTFEGGDWGSGIFGPCTNERAAGIAFATGSTGEWKSSTDNGVDPSFSHTEIASYCFGTWEECPCGNNGRARAGCEVSYGTGGVQLEATGTPSVSADTVTLSATGFNPSATPPGLFFQGDVAIAGGIGAPFNDGLLCAGGTVIRLKGQIAVGGAMSFGFGVPGALVSVKGAIPPGGGTRFYQVWFRNQAPQFCSPERFNQSNGVEITWVP